MTLTLVVVFSFLQSLFVLTTGQTCRNLPVYAGCSSNPDCGCLPFSSLDDRSGVCAYLHLNVSKLKPCNEFNYYCDQPYTVCVRHPGLSMNQPLCYPTGMASLDICPPLYTTSPTATSTLPPLTIEEVCVNVSWTKRGLVVAGSNYTGAGLHQLRNPTAILFDTNRNTLFVADNGNARIVAWQANAVNGVVVAGNNGEGNRLDQLAWVTDMLMDPKDSSLIICDSRNRRIIRWSQGAQEATMLIDNNYCTGLALDNQGLLYVAENDNHRVTQWILGVTATHNQVVAGGNGKGSRLDQLNSPSAIFVDQNGTIFVADYSNDRLVKWTKDAKEGILVGKVRYPKSIHVGQSGNIYAIDGYHSRVLRWTPDNINGTIIIGEQQYTLSQATDLAFDRNGNIYVSNHGAGRIDKFDIDRSTCL